MHFIKNTKEIRESEIQIGKDLIDKVRRLSPDAIIDKDELMAFIGNHPKSGSYDGIRNKMMDLERMLQKRYKSKIDPVGYIMYLYYEEELPVRDISAILGLFGLKIPRNTLGNMMNNVFSWKLRTKNDETATTLEKNRLKPQKMNRSRTEAIRDSNRILIGNILEGKKKIDIEAYRSCKNHQERINIVLMSFSLSGNEAESARYIQELNRNGNSMASIASIITRLFRSALGDHPEIKLPKLTSSDVAKMYFKKG